MAIIVEAAAINHRQKKMGYNAAKELYRRVQENLMRETTMMNKVVFGIDVGGTTIKLWFFQMTENLLKRRAADKKRKFR